MMKINGIGSKDITIELHESKKSENGSFIDMLNKFIESVNSDLKSSKEAEQQLIKGDVSNLEELMYRIEKSDISLRLLIELRNKALESYHVFMRMQV